MVHHLLARAGGSCRGFVKARFGIAKILRKELSTAPARSQDYTEAKTLGSGLSDCLSIDQSVKLPDKTPPSGGRMRHYYLLLCSRDALKKANRAANPKKRSFAPTRRGLTRGIEFSSLMWSSLHECAEANDPSKHPSPLRVCLRAAILVD